MDNTETHANGKSTRKSTPKVRRPAKEMPFLAQRVTAIRLEENLTQAQFAERLNTDKQTIHRIENGKIKLKTDLLQNICQTFDVSADYFFLQTTNRKSHKLNDNLDRDESLAKLRHELTVLCKTAAEIADKAAAVENGAKVLLNHPLLN